MRSNVELSATIRRAMEQKNLDREGLARALGISEVMVNKLLCGDIVPSRHLEKQMVEVLEIEPSTVDNMSDRPEKKTTAEAALEEKRRQVQKKPKAA